MYILLDNVGNQHSIDLSALRNVPIGICMFLRIESQDNWSLELVIVYTY